ncbi:MAG TPA: hypothetical protein VGQ30_15260 [Gemmatimonadaceae bacterium]|jgi:hypothetical protein|nr:hypothetical protein [Gemmatimonadaceae bacterium]
MIRFPTRRLSTIAVAALAAAMFAACGGSGSGSTGPGGGTVVVAASAGTTPNYTWSGPTAITIDVVRASSPSVAVWEISSPMSRNIPSGTQHGAPPPAGAQITANTEPVLTVGIKYRVTVALIDGTSGSVDFTP